MKGERTVINEMQKWLQTQALGKNCFCFESLDSTSSYIRRMWQLLPHGHTVIAEEQHSGRGRQGKSFYSPKGTGLYFSFLLKDEKYINDPLFTVKMSYAVCCAVDELTETEDVKIKWVNDIYTEDKKIAGILCEALNEKGSQGIIVGVGVNFSLDKAEIPSELKGKIGSLRDVTKKKQSREKLCALILNQVEKLYLQGISDKELLVNYRKRSNVLGREIKVIKNNEELRAAALDIAADGGLLVRYESGITEKLTAGEISIAVS